MTVSAGLPCESTYAIAAALVSLLIRNHRLVLLVKVPQELAGE